jgi:spermidine synthase
MQRLKYKEEGKRFELVIVDIFTGSSPSPLVGDREFLQNIRELLAPGGAVVVNVSGTAAALDAVIPAFPHHVTWKYDLNNFGVFWSAQ